MLTISVDEDASTITIDGATIEGFPYENKLCPTCDRQTYYYDHYDAIFCPECNAWLESRCNDPQCSYCPNRPAQPLPLGP